MSNGKPLRKWRTDELENALLSSSFDLMQKAEAERILKERFAEPDRRLARRINSAVAWALAFSMGTFIVSLLIYWLIATGR
jgi:hypothetical protein